MPKRRCDGEACALRHVGALPRRARCESRRCRPGDSHCCLWVSRPSLMAQIVGSHVTAGNVLSPELWTRRVAVDEVAAGRPI